MNSPVKTQPVDTVERIANDTRRSITRGLWAGNLNLPEAFKNKGTAAIRKTSPSAGKTVKPSAVQLHTKVVPFSAQEQEAPQGESNEAKEERVLHCSII